MRDNKVNVLKKMLGMLMIVPVALSLSLFAVEPIHHWELDETAGPTYQDTGIIGDANGTCTSPDGCPTSSDGQVYGAQSFDGIDDVIAVNGAAFNWTKDSNATIEFWMKSDKVPEGGFHDGIIGRTNNAVDSLLWYIGIDGVGNDGPIGSLRASVSDGGVDSSSIPVNNGKWHHIAYVLTPGKVKVYINGINDFNLTRTQPATDLVCDRNVTIGTLDNFIPDINSDWSYTGALDDIKLYATDLNGSTIKAHYEDGFKPHLIEVTQVPNPSTTDTPSYTFSSDKNGTIGINGSCISATPTTAIGDTDTTITFDPLFDATYSDCNITVTSTEADSDGNISDPLAVNSFVVDTSVPTSTTTTTTSGGGGGCSYNPDSKNFDMMFLLMIALGLFYPFRRRFIK